MYYTIYKTTNLVNGKIYIGCHKTEDINDDYIGSGKILKRAINKYGIDNFEKKILQVFDNAEDMFGMEAELVNESFVKDTSNYNLKIGGNGGWDHLNDGSKEHLERTIKGAETTNTLYKHKKVEWGKQAQSTINELRKDKDWVKRVSDNRKKFFDEGGEGSFKGKHHTDETKKKIGAKSSVHQKGKKNSQYGTCWIYNIELRQSKRIDKKRIDEWITCGWVKGAVFNWDKFDKRQKGKCEKF